MMNKKLFEDQLPTVFKIVKIIVGIAAIVILYTYKRNPNDMRKHVLSEASVMTFHGIVDSIYRQTSNHNIKTAKLIDGYTYELWPDWEELIEVGDSLVKNKNELQVKVYKSNGKIDTLDYKEMVKGFR